MKKLTLIALGLTMGTLQAQKQVKSKVADPQAFAKTITEAELKEHLYTYASDEFEGRETGEPGQKMAIAYLKEQYVSLGIPAAKGGDDYFQPILLEVRKVPTGQLSMGDISMENGEGFMGFTSFEGDFDQIVYAGYGIEEGDYSDYTDLEVSGKVVLVKSGEPKDASGHFVLSGSEEASKWSNISEALSKRVAVAKEKGAVAVLFFDQANFDRYQRRFSYMKENDSGSMGIKALAKESMPSFFLNTDLANKMLADIATDHQPKVLDLPLSFAVKSANKEVQSENVVAFLKGSELPEEYIVISSHLDHVGVNSKGEIHNGADDDGSGTVALLEIAEAFKTAADKGKGPKRSIVFLHVTGEEKGLLGSQYYTDVDPIFPLANTVANLNIDMVGRIDPKREGDRNYVYLIGSDKLSTELHELSEAVNDKYTKVTLDYTYNDENDPNRFYYRSDHYNFAKNNIPIIFYFNGTHDDYHKPGDTPDKINYDLLENRSRLVFFTAWELANRANRITVDKTGK
ncbi:M28 family peptidase [Flavobacteriaceae bacterium]|nr:M28 family peptidase [Flavobacteriaceae bacterium]MDC1394666.1 M28 family peptidase [Flavobacteriaceae bacterium]